MIKSLDKLVQLAQVSGGINVQCHFQGEWLVQHQCQAAQAIVHIVVNGQGWFKLADETNYRPLQTGDIVLLSRSKAHQLSYAQQDGQISSPSYVEQKAGIQIRKIQNGQGNELELFCACFHYEMQSELFNSLPDCLWLNFPNHVLQPILNLLKHEITQHEFTSQQIIDSLSNILLIELLRRYLQQQPKDVGGILRGIHDHRLNQLIQKILHCPEQDWSIEMMVKQSPISRAQLMRLFKQKIGQSPHAFVHKVRLQKAAWLLRNSADSILNIALSVGFQSETHFSKAFKTLFAITPSHYRKKE